MFGLCSISSIVIYVRSWHEHLIYCAYLDVNLDNA